MWAIIYDKPVPVAGDAQILSSETSHIEEMSKDGLIFRLNVAHASNGFLGNDHHMHRRLGIYVVKGKTLVILQNLFAGDLALEDLGEDGVCGIYSEHRGRCARLAAIAAGHLVVVFDTATHLVSIRSAKS